jgi:hypothetical protein
LTKGGGTQAAAARVGASRSDRSCRSLVRCFFGSIWPLADRQLPAFRKRAFKLMRTNAPSAYYARLCLRAIDELRDEYGKPLAEPHHPDLGTRMPWPEAAQLTWVRAHTE